jgi:hypothetical protein
VRISDWVAAAAFFISLTALVSNLLMLWLRWPRMVVEIALRHAAGEVFLLTVINNGSEPITVRSVGLTQAGRGVHRLDYLDTWRARAAHQLPTAHGRLDNQDDLLMPLRIDAHCCHVFEYPESALSDLPPGVPYYGYAARYEAFRWWPNRPMIHEIRSRHAVTRRLHSQ